MYFLSLGVKGLISTTEKESIDPRNHSINHKPEHTTIYANDKSAHNQKSWLLGVVRKKHEECSKEGGDVIQ